jgi:DNA polymerase III epsilon subunit-like protein
MVPIFIGEVSPMFFDLETTGRSRQRDGIIELAAVLGVEFEDAFFSEFVKPTKPIPVPSMSIPCALCQQLQHK